jgi:5-(carboxyamino)imidazole ribonucleotide synthase
MESSQRPREGTPTVGIVGAGQLARMAIQAATSLDVRVRVLAERPDDAAALVGTDVVIGSPRSRVDLAAFAAGCDVVTCDHELVDVEVLHALEAAGVVIRPGAALLALAQDKVRQRTAFAAAGFPVPNFDVAGSLVDVLAFGAEQGWPVVLKAGRGGYDGRGVWVLSGPDDAEETVPDLLGRGVPLLVEAWVPIEREIAVLVARRPGGERAVYPVVETVQRDGICRELRLPAPIPASVVEQAQELAIAVSDTVGAIGILALELFVAAGDVLIVNEIAARPHNSGHVTIEGCVTSQFEQHLRAVLDWPLGATDLVAPAAATVNILGGRNTGNPAARLRDALADPAVRVHWYGKSARFGRKLGHVTVLAGTHEEAIDRARLAASVLVGDDVPIIEASR